MAHPINIPINCQQIGSTALKLTGKSNVSGRKLTKQCPRVQSPQNPRKWKSSMSSGKVADM